MSRITRLLLCALTLAIALPAALVSAKTAVHHPAIGIGDDKGDLFSDARFRALGIKDVRYDMSWDALSVGWQRAEITSWLKAARKDGLNVLITIDHSDRVIVKKVHGKEKKFSQTRVLPTEAQYVAAFRAFRKLFPWVKEFATWDETNYYGEATYDKESLVASYYRGLRAACSSCTILAAEFLDVPKVSAVPIATWARAFVADLGFQPQYWGLNDYEEANNLSSASTRGLLSVVTGDVWLAETGGIVARRNGTKNPGFPQNATHAAKVDSYILNTLGSLSPRVQRIYLYEWDAKTAHDSWDTALISYTGAPRPGFDVLANTLDSWGIKPNCHISSVPPACAKHGKGSTLAGSATGASGTTGATG